MALTDDIQVERSSASFRLSSGKGKPAVSESVKKSLVVLLPVLFALLAGFLMARKELLGLGLFALIMGVATLLLCILSAEIGLYIILIYSFFISFFNRLLFNDELPYGVFSDLFTAVTFLGFIIRREKISTDIKEVLGTRVGILLVVIYIYTFFEVFNLAGLSIQGIFPVIRRIGGSFLLFLVSYIVFSDPKKIDRFIKVFFASCLLVALYGCLQEWHGFFGFETDWLMMDPKRYRMTFVNGGARRMSVFPDALSLSIIMAVASVFFAALAIMQTKISRRVILFTGVGFMLAAMTYSLTRTANAMFVAGIGLFILITINQKITRIFAGIAVGAFVILQFLPFANFNHNSHFVRTFRSGTKDPSYLVREKNRKSIQPYIYAHPFGGGLSTTGDEGRMYHPGHPLAGFPPDSGYLKKALEIGWVGFAIYLFLYFTVIKTGVNGYFSTNRPREKMLFATCTAALFCFYAGEFSQVAIGQITDIIVYYPFIAIILRLTKNIQTSQTQPQTS